MIASMNETKRSRFFNRFAADYPLLLFFVLAYLLAWLVFVPMVVLRGRPEIIAIATFAPTIAAIITHRFATGNFRAFRIYSTWARTIGAAAVGIILMVLAFVVLPAITAANARTLHWRIFLSFSVYNLSTLYGGPLGEEPGWRGYALPRLEHRFGPVGATLLLALLWAGWHIPLLFYPGWISASVGIYVFIVVGSSFILTCTANLARFGVIPAIATHAAFNTVSRFLGGLFGDTEPQMKVPFELVMALAGLAIALVLIVATRGRLAYHADKGV
jgi:membrane protease YdiL (CAAX protease family)